MRFETIEQIPQWAICYLVNDDASGLEDGDRKLVDAWYDAMVKHGIRPIAPIDGSENEFCPYPAFGEACGTVDFVAEVKGRRNACQSVSVRAR